MELRRSFSYRVDFWIQFIGQLFASAGVGYFLWKSIFSLQNSTEIQGYTFPAMVLYYLLVPITARIVQGVERGGVSVDIYEGSLTKYLVYPVPFFAYKYAGRLAVTSMAILQYLVVAALFTLVTGGFSSDIHLSVSGMVAGIALACLGGLVYFSLMCAIEMTAFWADNVWSLLVMLRFVTSLASGAWIPLSFYPNWFNQLAYWTPFPYLLYLPVQLAMGRASLHHALTGAGILLAWELVGCALIGHIWSRGIRQYSGVGI